MARMSIDDKFLRDPRVTLLGLHLNMTRFEAMGRLLAVFAICYDLERDVLTATQIDLAAERAGFADELFAVDLAVNTRGGMRIRGALERIDYLNHKRHAARIGGLKSGESRRNQTKHDPEARGNPPDPVPDPPPDPVPDPAPDQREKRGRARGPRGANPSSAELASVTRVLGKLGEHSGVAYGGAAQHVKLIIGRLRDGHTEGELRAVIALAAERWKGDDTMHQYLRPETLFGPQAIAKYIDPARTRYADMIAKLDAELAPQPGLALGSVNGGAR